MNNRQLCSAIQCHRLIMIWPIQCIVGRVKGRLLVFPFPQYIIHFLHFTVFWPRLNVINMQRFFYFQVNLLRSYTFRNSKQTYDGIPVMAANMDTVGTFEMAKVLASVSFPIELRIDVLTNYFTNSSVFWLCFYTLLFEYHLLLLFVVWKLMQYSIGLYIHICDFSLTTPAIANLKGWKWD